MNKQIEEMAFDMSASLVYFNGEPKIINWQKTLENMHKKGYRRQDEVAREIFAEIEKCFFEELVGCSEAKILDEEMFTELKEKYGV